ncbi:hypothetical protein NDU88_006505 [Pleurodeles waltl]|uniref:Uncharacterized protein n=1 Tax=Pleurodeles waltl TaxID=8319 RepID=A0AAV7MD69_PLEWA|nr:hypothetical protein NDU88_006505 [Pleurodeles waltl]
MRNLLSECMFEGQIADYSEGNKARCVGSSLKIRKGDWVKVKVKAGMWNKFRGPFRVREVHPLFVVLENGEKWNLRRVAKFGEANSEQRREEERIVKSQNGNMESSGNSFMLMDDSDLVHNDVDANGHEEGPGAESPCRISGRVGDYMQLRRSQRNHRTLLYLKDYV